MVDAVGPIFTGGFEAVTVGANDQQYSILYLPDKHNDDLQRAGKAPVYYWMPGSVRLARQGDTGDYKFHLIHFVGVRSSDTTVGVSGTQEVAGGVLSFTTTAAFPAAILQQSQDQLLARFRGNDLKYWGWRTPVAPMFRPMPIVDNMTAITNLSPNANGSIPSGATTPGVVGGRSVSVGQPRSVRLVSQPPPTVSTLTVPIGKAFRDQSNLDPWYWNLQGQGEGSINPTGENAYSGLIGSLPAAIVWQGFHGTYSPIVVAQSLKMKVWSQALRLVIDGNWDKVFQHFSAHATASTWWFSGDIKAEFNNMVTDGTITVQLEIDGTLPNADKMQEEINKRSDQIVQKFMDMAQKMIFDPAPPNVQPAQASGGGGFFGWGGGFALKYRRDETKLHLHYDETLDEEYLQTNVISSTLEGFYKDIKADPDAEKKYFTTLYLDDWDRKVTRILKPVVNWPDPSQKWVGEPVAFLSAQVGYPDVNGAIEWQGHIFQSSDGPTSAPWSPAMAMKQASDVSNAPQGWTPDKTFLKRQIHFTEPPSDSEYPYAHIAIEQNVVDLDPGDNGRLVNDVTLEVRADSAGTLAVGPMSLNVVLQDSTQEVQVSFKCLGKTSDGHDRPLTNFLWQFADQDQPRFWAVYTGQLDFQPLYQYQVHVVVKGSLFTKGMEWIGPWMDGAGNGPLVISVPTPDDQGVTKRSTIPGAPPVAQPASTSTTWTSTPPSETAPVASGDTKGVTVGAGTPPPATGKSIPPMPSSVPPVAVSTKNVGEGDGMQDISGWHVG